MIAAGRTEDHQYDVLARGLISLLRCGLTRREQLVVRAILLARTPSTAFKVAQLGRCAMGTAMGTARIPPGVYAANDVTTIDNRSERWRRRTRRYSRRSWACCVNYVEPTKQCHRSSSMDE